jgi:NtrC-family two-component system response regulator AlgB
MDIRRHGGIVTAGSRRDHQVRSEAAEEGLLLDSSDPATFALLVMIRRAAAGDSTILLTGESGTGKDVLARQIHRWSLRRGGPFVVINCGSLAESLVENELFGHVRGAFSGALNDRLGRLETADGGTVLFDEIAELPIALQTKFLRFVQDRSFERVGSHRTVNVDVRVVAASNRNLEAEVAARRFRDDLYYRLNVITFTLPPLRERTPDILPLAARMLPGISLAAGRFRQSLSPRAAEALINYRWPGNMRELHNALQRAVALSLAETITFDDLPDSIRHPASFMCVPTVHGARLKDFEREHVVRVLAESPTLEDAAASLGINVSTLWRKRKRYGI